MAERNSPEPTRLQELPKRFWTAEVVKVALKQGHNRLALEMVEDLMATATGTQTKNLQTLLLEAQEGLKAEQRTGEYTRVIRRLNQYLKRARQLKKDRKLSSTTGDASSQTSIPTTS